MSKVTPTLAAEWFLGQSWRVPFAPDFVSARAPYYEDDPYRYVFDITDLAKQDGVRITLENAVDPAYIPIVGTDCSLYVEELRLEAAADPSPMLETGMDIGHRINTGEPGAPPADYVGALGKSGEIRISSGNRVWPVTSSFASKGSSIQLQEVAAGGAGSTHLGRGRTVLTFANRDFTVKRTVKFGRRRAAVTDRITNRARKDLRLTVSHQLKLDEHGEALVRLAGRPVLDPEVRYSSGGNPTVHAAWRQLGLGLVCEDDVLRNQAVLFSDAEKGYAGVATETLLVPAGKSRELRWTIYPVASPEYYDFINLVRSDWGANYRLDGALLAFGGTRSLLSVPRPSLTESLRRLGINYAFELGGWVDHAQDPRRIGFGYGVMDPYWSGYRKSWRELATHLRNARPGVKVLAYFDTLRDTSYKSDSRFADSRMLDADGKQTSTNWGGQFQWTWNVFATHENSFGKAMHGVADNLIEDLSADGLAWDEMESIEYGAPLVTHGYSDGVSAIDDGSGETDGRPIGLVSLMGARHRMDVIRRMKAKCKLIIGNSAPLTKQMLAQRLPRFLEVQYNDLTHYEGDLSSPLGFVGQDASWAAVLRALDWGMLPVIARLDARYEALPFLFPFTPREIHSGYLLGEERIITRHSGVYGWPGERRLVQPHYFDDEGRELQASVSTALDEDGATTRVECKPQHLMVLERTPIAVRGRSRVTFRDVRYTAEGVSFRYSSTEPIELDIAPGEFRLARGKQFKVLVEQEPPHRASSSREGLRLHLPARENGAVRVAAQ